ncbi:hypothetical protein DM02DRAFT_60946 [Periconia macrospinosa]|uniref:Uncharacterized protein n=1 Tax=Periconia macrospinosa TaxID=97972 RepID=A0A2V1DLC6_9PLEO|nr:hypothetical protein DM02DRAFT_60946 [Periconia macrospinosa]
MKHNRMIVQEKGYCLEKLPLLSSRFYRYSFFGNRIKVFEGDGKSALQLHVRINVPAYYIPSPEQPLASRKTCRRCNLPNTTLFTIGDIMLTASPNCATALHCLVPVKDSRGLGGLLSKDVFFIYSRIAFSFVPFILHSITITPSSSSLLLPFFEILPSLAINFLVYFMCIDEG